MVGACAINFRKSVSILEIPYITLTTNVQNVTFRIINSIGPILVNSVVTIGCIITRIGALSSIKFQEMVVSDVESYSPHYRSSMRTYGR